MTLFENVDRTGHENRCMKNIPIIYDAQRKG